MKLSENNPQHIQLIAKYLSGEMDQAELHGFEKQVFVSAENILLLNEMKEQWNLLNKYSANKTPDTRKAWNKLYNRLDDELLVAANGSVKRYYTVKLSRVAAIVLVLVAGAAIVYLGLVREPKAEMVQMQS